MKIYLVSDSTGFALTDVYNGYIRALKSLKIPFEAYPYHLLRKVLSDEQCFNHVLANALMKYKKNTHVMFIGGLNVPEFFLDSFYHVKTIIVATEDPHSFDPNKNRRIPIIDYYFSNERTIGVSKKYDNVYYCPTAGNPHECAKMPIEMIDEKYHSDILFLGAMYPNRRKLLESIIPFVEKHNLSFKVCGHIRRYLPKSSPLWKYVTDDRTIPHHETVQYYNGAKVVLNILRDISWNPRTKSGKNPYNKSRFSAESLNPRAYEVPLCQSFMLIEDTRVETKEIFTKDEVGFFSDERSLINKLRYFLAGPGKEKREEMAFRAYKKVAENHTYTHRLKKIIDTIEEKEK